MPPTPYADTNEQMPAVRVTAARIDPVAHCMASAQSGVGPSQEPPGAAVLTDSLFITWRPYVPGTLAVLRTMRPLQSWRVPGRAARLVLLAVLHGEVRMNRPTTETVIEAIVECIEPKHQDDMRARLQALCEVACEEQRREFRRTASRLPAHGVLQ